MDAQTINLLWLALELLLIGAGTGGARCAIAPPLF